MNNKISAHKLSAKKVCQLIQTSGWFVDEDLAKRVSGKGLYIDAIYSHSDGRTLNILGDGIGWLYDSRQEWLAFFASLEELESQEPVHILRSRLLQGQHFAELAPDLANQLAEELNLSVEQLDRSRASLALIDSAIQNIEREDLLKEEIFTALTAYVGEVIKNATHARWEMRLASDGETWEPWLVNSGQSFPISSMLYDELYEEPDCSVSAIADICM